MHIRAIFENFASFIFCPNHKSIHRSFDVRLIIFVFSRLTNDFGTKNASFCKESQNISIQLICSYDPPKGMKEEKEVNLPRGQMLARASKIHNDLKIH